MTVRERQSCGIGDVIMRCRPSVFGRLDEFRGYIDGSDIMPGGGQVTRDPPLAASDF
jgi:hypothetical protein